ncbi:unnamed protein product [Arctia plantaginis]|uniref:ZAD domain-containing protein n=1 Tax=Arctia plantaginis TaxID=874455 RepID=A0A8S1B9J7_ARCPL|nr:unnamed protein product [Arctia plantaginis]
MYESLVLMPLETTDGRPVLACYICCARLKNCYELRKSCFQSEELLTQMLSCNELKPVKLQEVNNKKRLTVQNVSNLSIGHALEINTVDVGVEALTIDVKFEQNDPEDIDENDLENNIQSADSDDDPLIVVKKEQSNIDEDALEENSVSDIIQSADSDDEPLINVKNEQSGDWTSDNKDVGVVGCGAESAGGALQVSAPPPPGPR